MRPATDKIVEWSVVTATVLSMRTLEDVPTAQMRLAVYGTLAPGRVNHHQLAGLKGDWRRGSVRGHLDEAGWGEPLGYPALSLDPDGPIVDVFVFESPDLPAHWARLDEFEGDGYRRVVTTVRTDEGDLDACIYVASTAPA